MLFTCVPKRYALMSVCVCVQVLGSPSQTPLLLVMLLSNAFYMCAKMVCSHECVCVCVQVLGSLIQMPLLLVMLLSNALCMCAKMVGPFVCSGAGVPKPDAAAACGAAE